MGIYTKTGDKGTTSLFDGVRVKKNSLRVDTYGTFDELNAQMSVAEKIAANDENKKLLIDLQYKLFYLSAEIATKDIEKLKAKSITIDDSDIKQLESVIDNYASCLPKVDSFVLPGRSIAGAQLHVARTVCRRAERLLNKLAEEAEIREILLIFTNRLSDCLYMLARMEDMEMQLEKAMSEIIKRYEQATSVATSPSYAPCALEFDKVQNVLLACIDKAKELAVPVTIAIVDAAGNKAAFYRMPDCLLISSNLACKKAYTAVAMKKPTDELQAATQPGAALYQLESICEGKIVTFGGGLPLYYNDRIVGGLGVSGGTVNEDILIAAAGKKIYEEGE